jgi:hypothetical protein
MSDKDHSFIVRLFAAIVAFTFAFIIVAIVGGFIIARLQGVPVDVQLFYTTINPPFTMILGAILGYIAGGTKKDATPAP